MLIDCQHSDKFVFFVLLFSAATCCINIAAQASSRAKWSESHSTSVELTRENSRLCRRLCRWPTALRSPTPTVGEGIEFQMYKSSQGHSTPQNATAIEFVDSSESIAEMVKCRKSRVSQMWSSCLRELEAPQNFSQEYSPGTWLMAEKRLGFLKGPLLV